MMPSTPEVPLNPTPKARVEPLSVDRFGVHFTADGEFRDLLEAARALASHRLPAGNMAELMKLALKAFIEVAEKRRFGVGRKPRGARASSEGGAAKGALRSPVESDDDFSTKQGDSVLPGKKGVGSRRSRHIPAAVAREVYLREQGRCSFVSADGRRCECRAVLDIDHVRPWAVGGPSTAVNLRLRCRAHNLLHARRYFGVAYMAAAVARGVAKRRNEQLDNDERARRNAGAVERGAAVSREPMSSPLKRG